MSAARRGEGRRRELASLRVAREPEDLDVAPSGRRRLVFAAAAVLLALVLWLVYRAMAARPVVVQVASASARPSGAPVRGAVLAGTGYVVTGEKYIAIGVRVAGRIERYFVD